MSKCVDLIGQRFGNLTVIERYGTNKHNSAIWLCKCDCGKEVVIPTTNLKTGNSKSCGCMATQQRREKFLKHGMRYSRLYDIWRAMKQRCYYKQGSHYDIYGARGITVCEEWKNDFMSFYNWAIANGYADDLTIDRIDVNGNYEPSNCRWVTVKDQNNNKRSNHLIDYHNKTQNLTQWCKELSVQRHSVYELLNKGYTEQQAFNILLEKRKLIATASS